MLKQVFTRGMKREIKQRPFPQAMKGSNLGWAWRERATDFLGLISAA